LNAQLISQVNSQLNDQFNSQFNVQGNFPTNVQVNMPSIAQPKIVSPPILIQTSPAPPSQNVNSGQVYIPNINYQNPTFNNQYYPSSSNVNNVNNVYFGQSSSSSNKSGNNLKRDDEPNTKTQLNRKNTKQGE
jgi:hypothetical protein